MIPIVKERKPKLREAQLCPSLHSQKEISRVTYLLKQPQNLSGLAQRFMPYSHINSLKVFGRWSSTG